jgi:hypothetical protein
MIAGGFAALFDFRPFASISGFFGKAIFSPVERRFFRHTMSNWVAARSE